MSYGDLKEKLKRENCLGQVDTLGSFDFYTTIISLDSVREEQLQRLSEIDPDYLEKLEGNEPITSELYLLIRDIFPLAIHEYTHFIDATSTLWGLEHLEKMNAAYSCADTHGGTEDLFHRAKSFFDHARGLRLPSYYTTVDHNVANVRPWRYRHTVGQAFDLKGRLSEKPIVFTRFSNARDESLSRSPISMVSLLEGSAMAQEVQASAGYFRRTDHGYQVVEGPTFNRTTFSPIYDPALTEYSVCVHAVANRQRTTELITTFALCGLLVRMSLNWPDVAFQNAIRSCDIARIIGVPEGSNQALTFRRGLELRDRGILFYLLLMAMPQGSLASLEATYRGIESALERFGTPLRELIRAQAEEAVTIRERIGRSRFRSLELLADAGLANFRMIDPLLPQLNLRNLNLPKVWLGDMTAADPLGAKGRILSGLSVDDIFDELYAGELWTKRFSEACFWAP